LPSQNNNQGNASDYELDYRLNGGPTHAYHYTTDQLAFIAAQLAAQQPVAGSIGVRVDVDLAELVPGTNTIELATTHVPTNTRPPSPTSTSSFPRNDPRPLGTSHRPGAKVSEVAHQGGLDPGIVCNGSRKAIALPQVVRVRDSEQLVVVLQRVAGVRVADLARSFVEGHEWCGTSIVQVEVHEVRELVCERPGVIARDIE
jgi:hypothetical protein